MSFISNFGKIHHKKRSKQYIHAYTLKKYPEGSTYAYGYVPTIKPVTKISDTIYFGFQHVKDHFVTNGRLILENKYYAISYVISENTKRLNNRMSDKNFHKEMVRLLDLRLFIPISYDMYDQRTPSARLSKEQVEKINSENVFTIEQSIKVAQVYHSKIPNKIRELLSGESESLRDVGMTLLLNMIKDNKIKHNRLKKNTSKYLSKIKK